jgi:hypothetical protein
LAIVFLGVKTYKNNRNITKSRYCVSGNETILLHDFIKN